MHRTFILLVIGLAAVGLLYASSRGGHAASDAARYRHYYAIGRRECRALVRGLSPQPVAGITGWTTGGVHVAIKVPRGVPAKYRKAMTAGCAAAAG